MENFIFIHILLIVDEPWTTAGLYLLAHHAMSVKILRYPNHRGDVNSVLSPFGAPELFFSQPGPPGLCCYRLCFNNMQNSDMVFLFTTPEP